MLSNVSRIMNTFLRFGILAGAFSFIAVTPCSRASEPKFVPIASWQNSAEVNKKDGNRAFAILREHKIKGVAPGSAGVTLNVGETQAAEARKLLAKAIVSEGLRIELIDDKGKAITPAEILGPRNAK
ncbi:MAG: hypothetical protein ABL949_16250 [Fimbriimonadaceae bacterium]